MLRKKDMVRVRSDDNFLVKFKPLLRFNPLAGEKLVVFDSRRSNCESGLPPSQHPIPLEDLKEQERQVWR